MAKDLISRVLAMKDSSPTKNYARFSKSSEQTGITAGSSIVFNTTDVNIGTGITLNTTTGVITLKSGSTFKLEGSVGSIKLVSGACSGSWVWKYSTDGGTTWNSFGNVGESMSPAGTTWDAFGGNVAKGALTTTAQTLIKLSVLNITGSTIVGALADTPSAGVMPWCEIQEISKTTPSNTVSTVSQISDMNDKTTSGYFDIGTMRIQWGYTTTTSGSPQSVTLPVPYANSTYVVTVTPTDVNADVTMSPTSKTTTGFSVNKMYDPTGSNTLAQSNNTFNWIAIGLKP